MTAKSLPRKGFKGVDRRALMPVCKNNIAEWGTENGCAKA